MKRQHWKCFIMVLSLLAGGICYSCSGQSGSNQIMELEAASEEETMSASSQTERTISLCYVHICGAVKKPGVYELETGTRIFQAIEQAGGFTEDAREEALNLALEVEDGMQIAVPSETDAEVLAGINPADDRVNLNTASKAELMTLTGIGEARAEAILQYREEHGAFAEIEELKNVSGIKQAAYEKIKDDITV